MSAVLDPESERRIKEDGICSWCEKYPRVATSEGWKCAGCGNVIGACDCNEEDKP